MNFLLLNQCFYPDVAATAQQLSSLALELASRGHHVTVIASNRAYDNSANRFRSHEIWNSVRIIRISSLAFGKGAKWRRTVNFGTYLVHCAFRLLLLPRFDAVVALTSPPLISFVASLFVKLKGGRLYCWVMDLNPDEAIAAGWLRERAVNTKILNALVRYSLRQAEKIIVLDRFMKHRIQAKGIPEQSIIVVPPSALDDAVGYNQPGREAFRNRHNLSERFVVMYSGNHSPCHPLDTLLKAAHKLADRRDIAFCFVGGGSEQQKVQSYASHHGLNNIACLPYQPLAELSHSLSAADLHTVVMGDAFPGIIHPCKVYNILTVGIPFLYIGPQQSHVADIATMNNNGYGIYQARHGEVDKIVNCIVSAAESNRLRVPAGARDLAVRFSKRAVLPQIVQILEGRTS